MPPKVVITDSSYPDMQFEREELAVIDADLEAIDAKTPEAVVERAQGADALLNQETELTATVFEELEELSVVARYGVGVDNIDLDAAAAHDVSIVNVPSYCEEEVATHALSLLLACVRRTPAYDRQVKRGEWDWKEGRPIEPVSGQTVGFVAFGSIAQRFAELLDGFDVDFVAFDPYQDDEVFDRYDVTPVSFDELLDQAGVLSIHAPLTDETRALFDDTAFDRMKDDALLLNVARGEIVDEDALARALETDQIGGAGLDVMANEPPGDSPLLERDDVVLTPHAAWYSESSMERLRRSAARGVASCLQGKRPRNLAGK